MITIKQDNKPLDIDRILLKNGEISISLNEDTIKDDIEKYKEQYVKIKEKGRASKNHLENIEKIIKYLQGLLSKSQKDNLSIKWVVDKNIVKSYPIEIKSIPEYKLQATDYININQDEEIVYMDYTELADIIAFELMYRDLGETRETLENKLENIGIISVYDSNELTKYFEESPYALSKLLRIGKSPYKNTDNELLSYFGDKAFKTGRYLEPVRYSCMYAMTLIVEDILKSSIESSIKIRLCGICDTGIYIIKSKEDKAIMNILQDNVCIRALGRKFEVKPKIAIF